MLDLPEALKLLVARFRIEYGLRAELRMDCLPTLSQASAIVAYRVTQEALRNVVRHSGTQWARVQFAVKNEMMVGSIKDHGQGFEERETRRLGLKGMKERCEILGGSLNVRTQPGGGTTITFVIPLITARSLL